MPPDELPVTVERVEAARDRIRPYVIDAPLVPSYELSRRTGVDVGLDLESLQPTGSFKVRGAAAKLTTLSADDAARGVVTASTGNHGRAVAHVAREAGVSATVCVSDQVPPGKVAALEALGCELVVGGRSQAEALATAAHLVTERGLTLVHPFDDPDVVAGQGTIGLELAERRPDDACVLVPLSGGGLVAGIAVALAARRPDTRVVGVSMERGAVMAASLAAGHPVDLEEAPTLADSLRGGIGLDNAVTFPIARALVDEVVLVSEQEIWDAMRFAFDHHRLVLEGAGAVGIAALLADRVTPEGPVTVVCSGGNAEPATVEAIATGRPTPPT